MNYEEFLGRLSAEGLKEQELAEVLVKKLLEKELKIATAESCTGGLISQMITSVSGASGVFDCGVCSYANSIKEKLLGVKKETLKAKGAVSPETAMEMAKGILRLSGADIGISVTGVAGPTGGTKEKPVGTVYIGVATMAKNYYLLANFAEKKWTRDKIRQSTANIAIYCGIEEISLL